MGERIPRIERKVPQLKPKRSFSQFQHEQIYDQTKHQVNQVPREMSQVQHIVGNGSWPQQHHMHTKKVPGLQFQAPKPWLIICLETTVCIHDIH